MSRLVSILKSLRNLNPQMPKRRISRHLGLFLSLLTSKLRLEPKLKRLHRVDVPSREMPERRPQP